MQAVLLTISAILFVASSGLLFNDRFRRNRLLVGMAAILAIASTVTLIYAIMPYFGLGGIQGINDNIQEISSNKVESNTNVASNKPDTSDASPNRNDIDCDWYEGDALTACIDLMRRHYPERLAMAVAFASRGRFHYTQRRFNEAIQDYGVAIQNSENPRAPVYMWRGLARIMMGDYAGGLDDCDRVADPSNPTALSPAATRIPTDPNYVTILNTCRGMALSNLGRHADALPALELAVGSGQATWQVYSARATSRAATGNRTGAESDRQIAGSMLADEIARATADLSASNLSETAR